MANKNKNFYNIGYSIDIDSSTYYVLGHCMKNSKYSNTYLLAENAAIRSKSFKLPTTLSTRMQRSRSLKRSISTDHRPKTSPYHKVTPDTNFIAKQQKSNQTHNRRCIRSKSKRIHQTPDRNTNHQREATADPIPQEITKEKHISFKSIEKKRKGSIETTKDNQKQDILRLFDEQKLLLSQLFEQHIRTITTPSIDTVKQIITETLKSQQQQLTKELERSLIETIQQELQKSLPKTDDQSQTNSLDTSTINRLQDILLQTIEKHIASTNKHDNNTLNRLFTEQKQVLIDTLTQQQSTSSINLIKQAITDALTEQTTTIISNPKIINYEVKITANLKQTRIDAAFRQQRDTIVANRYLRDTVRQWSNVRSISSLIKKIQACGTNDLENAWLLFCWIGQNIRFDSYCQHNSSENVFQNRTGVCQGFVSLYHQCCSLLNIQRTTISGYTKQTFLKQNEDLKKHAHAWNAIVFEQYTYLIDPTWGAGGGDDTNELEDFYFLTSPEELIYTHYSNDYQLLQPEITKQEFLSLPVMKSNYYRLNLNLLTPKQGFNQTNENIFQVSIKTPAYVDLFASLKIDNTEYPRHLHTLCQRHITQTDTINCFLAPPTNGLYEIVIYAKTIDETTFCDAIYMRLNVSNIHQAITFPITYQPFIEYKCILIEPFQRLVHENERIFISMKIPGANAVKIKNGDDYIVPNNDEYKNDLLKKEIVVQGDLHICARWDHKADQVSTICVFNMT